MFFYCDTDVVKKQQLINHIQTDSHPPALHCHVPLCVWPTWCSWNSRCCSWNSAPSLASKCDLTLLTPPPSPPPQKASWLLSLTPALQNTAAKWRQMGALNLFSTIGKYLIILIASSPVAVIITYHRYSFFLSRSQSSLQWVCRLYGSCSLVGSLRSRETPKFACLSFYWLMLMGVHAYTA